MKRVLFGICTLIGMGLIATGITIIYKDNNNKRIALEQLKENIINNYEVFKSKVEVFSENRSNISQQLNDIKYLSELKTNYASLIQGFQNYEKSLRDIDEASADLKVDCLENTFKDTNINNKVSAFIINYEQVVNYFIKDVNDFNTEIQKYNAWVSSQTTPNEKDKLEEYKSTYVDYVDIDGDGVYSGVKNN